MDIYIKHCSVFMCDLFKTALGRRSVSCIDQLEGTLLLKYLSSPLQYSLCIIWHIARGNTSETKGEKNNK